MHSKGKIGADNGDSDTWGLFHEETGGELAYFVTLPDMKPSLPFDEAETIAKKIASLINAADGMTTEEAVKYITHGREMEHFIRNAYMSFDATVRNEADRLLANLNKEGA